MDTWRIWELVLPALEGRHDVLAPTLPGHAGGPSLAGKLSDGLLADEVERAMDLAGFGTAHIVGNSLGGFVALELAARGRATTIVALAPAGGWAKGDDSDVDLLRSQKTLRDQVAGAAPHADALAATMAGRRRLTQLTTVSFEHIPAELLAHQMLGIAGCRGAGPMIDHALRHGWMLDAERITCPVRIIWGTDDVLLPWPRAARRYREDWLPRADWVVLDRVGHCPQLDIPLETSELILGFTSP